MLKIYHDISTRPTTFDLDMITKMYYMVFKTHMLTWVKNTRTMLMWGKWFLVTYDRIYVNTYIRIMHRIQFSLPSSSSNHNNIVAKYAEDNIISA